MAELELQIPRQFVIATYQGTTREREVGNADSLAVASSLAAAYFQTWMASNPSVGDAIAIEDTQIGGVVAYVGFTGGEV